MPAIDRRLIQNFEWPLFGLVLLLALIGVLNLISAAPETADWIPEAAERQFYFLVLGLICLVVSLLPDYRSLERPRSRSTSSVSGCSLRCSWWGP